MGYLAAIAAMLVWGVVQIPVKMAKAPGRVGVMVAMPAGLIVLLIILLCQGALVVPVAARKDWVCVLLTGLFMFPIATYMAFEAIRLVGLTTATPITRLEPVLAVAASGVLALPGFSWAVVPAAALVFGGGLLLAKGARDAQPVESRRELRAGMLYALGACLFWATGDVLIALVDPDLPRLLMLFYGLSFGMLVYFLAMGAFGRLRELRLLTRKDVVCYAIQGVGSFALGYWAFFESIRLLGLSPSIVISGCWPLVAVVAGVFIFREPMNLLKLAGVALFIAGAVLAGLGPLL